MFTGLHFWRLLDSATPHSPVELLALDLFNWLLRRGIDVFGGAKFVHLQHSWHDDPIIKFQVMQQVVAAFMQRHHYEPSFWLDKACIDQENTADGLRILPVSVMACNIVLATCGSTYVNRLWCIWELFVVVSIRIVAYS